ncbi:two-component sensor histidine kinase [Paenibacillus agaridevorans]|uniref:Two-component sensor histidine kinase n=1 Tax=Paenibacillus agaridevorans TaxID=171404 RepID=A0A2R5EP05_9BACL|nr:two-component sensor histidine kinase [Paenibacillus agaridevorans]
MASQQIQSNTITSINDTIAQTKDLINDKLTIFVVELIALENNSQWLSIMRGSDNPERDLDPQDYIFIDKSLEAYFDRYSMLDSVLFYYNQGRISWYKRDSRNSNAHITLENYAEKLDSSRLSIIKWLNIHDEKELNAPKVVSAYKMFGKDRYNTKGMLLFNIKSKFFSDILNNAKISTNGYLTIVSNDGMMRFKNVEKRYEIKEELLQNELMQTEESAGQLIMTSNQDENMLVFYDTLPINKWKIAAVLPEREVLERVNSIKYVMMIVMLLVIIAAVFLSNVIANIITKPLINLTRKVNRIEEGNLDIPFKTSVSNEIGVLSRGIQDMMHRIRDLLKEVENEQEKKRAAELAVLQSQIKPHFLYNTLYSIRQLYEMGDTKEAGEMVTALSQFFRISINKGSEIITIAQEIEHIKNYLYIQHLRYREDFIYEIDIDPDISECHIVKLTLQPLVENAIYHGIKQHRGQGLIAIRGYADGRDIIMMVEDNGVGMSEEDLASMNQSLKSSDPGNDMIGFGTHNVNKRLQLNYGLSYGLTYHANTGGGVTVTVKIRS